MRGEPQLIEIGDGLFAYLQPGIGWGWSNAGLICGDDASLLVDTLFDRALTEAMLREMAPALIGRPLTAAVNTHGDPDHCFGNVVLPTEADIYASRATAAAIGNRSPEALHALTIADDLEPDLATFVAHAFGPFDFRDLETRVPLSLFDDRLELDVGGRRLELLALGPAHTTADTIVHVPDADVVFCGDLLFTNETPIVWSDPSGWIEACAQIRATGAQLLVAGHGPIGDQAALDDIERYLRHIRHEASDRHRAGMSAEAAADDIDVSDFVDWTGSERLVANVLAVYGELEPTAAAPGRPEMFAAMGRWLRRHNISR